jgi:hypothetical protein
MRTTEVLNLLTFPVSVVPDTGNTSAPLLRLLVMP